MSIAQDIAGHDPSEPTMDLIHTTTATIFRSICNAGSINPQMCPVMNEQLTYFFYGRPAYRPGPIARTDICLDTRPVCMLFKRKEIHNVVGTYPCDTGAHYNKLYSPHLDGVSCHDLDCAAVPEAENRIVTRYFGSNKQYFFGYELPVLSPEPTSPTALQYHGMISSPEPVDYDDRSRTIEVTQNSALLINTIYKIVMPDFLLADDTVKSFIKEFKNQGREVKYYRSYRQTNAARTVEQFFTDVGLLQGVL